MPAGMSALKPRSPDRNSMDEALVFVSHQEPPRQSKLPALRDTPRSSLGRTALHVFARPNVNRSVGCTRQVFASNITMSSTPRPCHAADQGVNLRRLTGLGATHSAPGEHPTWGGLPTWGCLPLVARAASAPASVHDLTGQHLDPRS